MKKKSRTNGETTQIISPSTPQPSTSNGTRGDNVDVGNDWGREVDGIFISGFSIINNGNHEPNSRLISHHSKRQSY